MLNLHEDLAMVQAFQSLLRGTIRDHEFVAWQLALARTAAINGKVKFVWFPEDEYGHTYNGLTAIDSEGGVLHRVITGFDSDSERLLAEAMLAQEILQTVDDAEEDMYEEL